MTEKVYEVSIGKVLYNIDSDNAALLKTLPGKKQDPVSKQWVDCNYGYLPIGTIYTLLNGLFDSYSFESLPMVFTGEEYKVSKKVFNPKTKSWDPAEEVVKVYEKTIKIKLFKDGVTTEYTGYAQGVASQGILTSDQARNGFTQKMAARARKEALKNVGRVFRMDDEVDDDNDQVVEEVVDVAKSIVEKMDEIQTVSLYDDALELLYKIDPVLKQQVFKANLTSAVKEAKKKNPEWKQGTKEFEALKQAYEFLSAKAS